MAIDFTLPPLRTRAEGCDHVMVRALDSVIEKGVDVGIAILCGHGPSRIV